MVNFIRDIEIALGSSVKKPTIEEEKNKIIVRKSIVAKRKKLIKVKFLMKTI